MIEIIFIKNNYSEVFTMMLVMTAGTFLSFYSTGRVKSTAQFNHPGYLGMTIKAFGVFYLFAKDMAFGAVAYAF